MTKIANNDEKCKNHSNCQIMMEISNDIRMKIVTKKRNNGAKHLPSMFRLRALFSVSNFRIKGLPYILYGNVSKTTAIVVRYERLPGP